MNKFIGIGRLTADPEVRYSNKDNEQLAIAKYKIAINRAGKDAGADYISCVAFGKNGEFAEKYLKKGMKIAVVGRVQTGSYTNKDGQKVYTTDIVIESQEFCETKKESAEATPAEAPDGFLDVPDGIENDLPFK